MAIRYRTTHYLVVVDGAFDERGVWMIQASVFLMGPVDASLRENVIVEAKRAVLLAIIEESRRGRIMGAKQIQVSRSPLVRGSGEQPSLDA